MNILLYFLVIGGLLYKVFLKTPTQKNTLKTSQTPPFVNNGAAGINVR